MIILIALSLISFGQGGPNKNKVDSSKLILNQLFDYYGNTAILRGAVQFPVNQPGSTLSLDSNRNLLIGLNPHLFGNTVNNFVQADNVFINNGSNNSLFGKNVVIDTSDNVFAQVTDGHFYRGSHYSSGFGDGLGIGSYASITAGFGDWNFVTYGAVFGNNNVAGSLTKPQSNEEAQLLANKYSGGLIVGQGIRTQGNGIYTIGENFNSIQKGIHLGIGANEFSVLPGNIIVINGVPYHFPSIIPQPGSIFTYTGNGNVEWVLPAIAVKQNQTAYSTPQKPLAVFDLSGRLIGYTRQMK